MAQHRAAPSRRRVRVRGALVVSAAVTAGAVGLGMAAVTPKSPSSTVAEADPPRRVASAGQAPPRAVPAEAAAPFEEAAAALSRIAPPVPLGSGSGRRVVFSEPAQRVWLVGSDGDVERTYLVSGSVYDNLEPGTYAVFSRSEQAWGIDDSGTMRWFVRFAHGPNAAIGFHDIPIDEGRRVQTLKQLGTPLSHGCVRQRTTDAIALWEFAPIGTKVVVV